MKEINLMEEEQHMIYEETKEVLLECHGVKDDDADMRYNK